MFKFITSPFKSFREARIPLRTRVSNQLIANRSDMRRTLALVEKSEAMVPMLQQRVQRLTTEVAIAKKLVVPRKGMMAGASQEEKDVVTLEDDLHQAQIKLFEYEGAMESSQAFFQMYQHRQLRLERQLEELNCDVKKAAAAATPIDLTTIFTPRVASEINRMIASGYGGTQVSEDVIGSVTERFSDMFHDRTYREVYNTHQSVIEAQARLLPRESSSEDRSTLTVGGRGGVMMA